MLYFLLLSCIIVFLVGGMSHATVYFNFNAESNIVDVAAPTWATCACTGVGTPFDCCTGIGSNNGCEFDVSWYYCASGEGVNARVTIRDDIITPDGTKYMEWSVLDNQHDAYNEIKNKNFPHTINDGTTLYWAYYLRVQPTGVKPVFTAHGNMEKGIEIHGNEFRNGLSIGRSDAFSDVGNDHFTFYMGNASYHYNTAANGAPTTCREINDVFLQNQNGYSASNPFIGNYNEWYAIVGRLDMVDDYSGTMQMYVNGTKVLEYTGCKSISSMSSELLYIEAFGTLDQPSYTTGAHKRQIDALIVTDNWQDIIDGGYLADSPSGGTSPNPVKEFVLK